MDLSLIFYFSDYSDQQGVHDPLILRVGAEEEIVLFDRRQHGCVVLGIRCWRHVFLVKENEHTQAEKTEPEQTYDGVYYDVPPWQISEDVIEPDKEHTTGYEP